ncbi:hypothetical protein MnTg02_02686 [bacterium MnTg02]|nr:hypothetical protein MnTg02_02686 [bacterium MnTg02]
MFRIVMITIALALTAGVAISAIPTNHTHKGQDVISHQGPPLDKSGCHLGPTGYHCH